MITAQITEQFQPILTFASAVPSSSTTTYISMKNVHRLVFFITCVNGGTVTAGNIGLQQATAIAGTSQKVLSFTEALRALDIAANGQTLSKFTVTGDAFAPDATINKTNLYAIEVSPDDLDINNNFDCVRVTLANQTGVTISVTAFAMMKFGGRPLKSILTN